MDVQLFPVAMPLQTAQRLGATAHQSAEHPLLLASISTLLGSPNSCLACYGNEWVHDPKRQPYLIDS